MRNMRKNTIIIDYNLKLLEILLSGVNIITLIAHAKDILNNYT